MSRATKPHVESQGTKAPQSTAPPALMWRYQGQEIEESGGKEYTEAPQHTNPSKDPLTMASAEERVRASQKVGHLRRSRSTTSSSTSTSTVTASIVIVAISLAAILVITSALPFPWLLQKHYCAIPVCSPSSLPL